MTVKKWVTVKNQQCPFLKREVEQLELRVYAAEFLSDVEPYRVEGRKCSDDIVCNVAGYPCQWAYTNPFVDNFNLE